MKKATTLAVVAALGLVSVANAQYVKPLGLSVRLGVFYPSNGDARDIEGQGWFAGGAELKMGNLKFNSANPKESASWSISLDYYGKGSFSNIPLLVNYVHRNDNFYFSGGAGVGFNHTTDKLANTASNTEFTYQLSAGYDFVKMSTPLFVEVRYFGSSESKLSGFGIYGGFRF